MDYRWDVMVAITVPKGLNGWQNRGKVIINGRKFLFPVGVSTMVPEPVAFYVEESIKREEANNRPPSMPPEDEGADCECIVSIIESARPTKADLGSFAVLGPVRLPNAESIEMEAFAYCDSLTSVSLPVATRIVDCAFMNCNSLASVDLPMATSIRAEAFSGCTVLRSISLPMAANIGLYAFSGCYALASVSGPVATSVGNCAFDTCVALKRVDLPVATGIGDNAFCDCISLTSIDLPVATWVGTEAFFGCTNFSALILRTTETVCTIDVTAILGTKIMTTEGAPTGEGGIYIPASMDSAYRAAYEPLFEQLGAAGLYDILFRRLEDYTVDGTATGKLDESKI